MTGIKFGLLLMLAVAGMPFSNSAYAAREISPNRECSTCHIMWLTEFNRKDVKTLVPYDPKPVVDTGKQDVASTERMCFSCHDGFVLDSRFVWAKREHFHPVGVEPSEKIHIPTADGKVLFPLNEDGKIYCGTCHSAHGVDWQEEFSPLFLRVKNVNSSLCLACHIDWATGSKEGNHPVFKKMPQAPERLVNAGSKFGKDNTVICQSCHRVHGAGDKKLLAVSNKNSALCGTCHADRYANDRKEAAGKGTHPVNIVSQTVTVPEELALSGAKLGEGGVIICQTCHMPHYAVPGTKILVKPNGQSALCKTCHINEQTVTNTKHNIALKDEADKNVRGQSVAEGGVCSACHVPHGGRGPKMWAREMNTTSDPVSDLCLSCHSEGRIASAQQVGEYSHPVGRDVSRLGHPIDFPTYDQNGVKITGKQVGSVACASCHNPHQWDPEEPQKSSKPGDPGDSTNRFLRKRNGPENVLCLSCHQDKKSVVGTKHDPDSMKLGKRDNESVCGVCHMVHNGKGPRMWARELHQGVDPVSSLCMSCHSEEGLAKKKTVGQHTHPVDVPIDGVGIQASYGKWKATGENVFNDKPSQALPLFDKKGVKVDKGGRVTCASCHDPHKWAASLPDGPLKSGIGNKEGDGTNSFLRIENDKDSTICTNCHVDKGMVALSKHNLRITAPRAKNIEGSSANEGSLCGQCHVPHNGGGLRMWARTQGLSGEDQVAALCEDCHKKGGLADKKLTGEYSHPLQVDVRAKLKVDSSLPLFDADGRKVERNGKLSCASCHNPHQWSPGDPRSKSGAAKNVEGHADDSFLRRTASPNGELCLDCHKDKRFVIGTDHDLAVSGPTDVNSKGKTVFESGVCGQCHAVHNAESALRLWARAPGTGIDPMESLCRSCHGEGKVAAAKNPLKATHPPDVKVMTSAGRAHPRKSTGYTPVFDDQGNVSRSGVISCPTCHNPHKWSALSDATGPGKNLEGDVRNSFLRNKSDLSLCSNCHGMDALFRYKYFHGESSRVKHRLN